MINTQLQDLSFLTPEVPKTQGTFLSGLAKGFTKGAMRNADAAEGAEPDFPGLDGKNGEIGPTPPKQPGLLEKISGFFTDPMAMQKYRQERAQTKEMEQNASLGEVLQRDLGGLVEQFRNTKNSKEMFEFMKNNAGITVTEKGNQLMTMFARVAGQINQAERLSDIGIQQSLLREEVKDLGKFGAMWGNMESIIKARQNAFVFEQVTPLMQKFELTKLPEKLFDPATGVADLSLFYPWVASLKPRAAAGRSEFERLNAGLPPEQQEQNNRLRMQKLVAPESSETTELDPTTGKFISYKGPANLSPVLARQAQDTVDMGIAALDNIDVLESGIDQNEAAIGALGILQGWKESGLGVARPNEPQPVNEFRKKVDMIQKQLIPVVRGQTKGIIDTKEEKRINELLNFDSAIATPKLVKSILKDIKQLTAMGIVRQWSRAPANSRQPLPQGVVDVISSPFVAGIMVRNGGVDPEVLKRLKIQKGPANANHIQALFDNAVIDQQQAKDLALYNVANPDKTDIRLPEFVELIRSGAVPLEAYKEYEAMVLKRNPKATFE